MGMVDKASEELTVKFGCCSSKTVRDMTDLVWLRYGQAGPAGAARPGRYLRTTPCITQKLSPPTVFELHGSNFTIMFPDILSMT